MGYIDDGGEEEQQMGEEELNVGNNEINEINDLNDIGPNYDYDENNYNYEEENENLENILWGLLLIASKWQTLNNPALIVWGISSSYRLACWRHALDI